MTIKVEIRDLTIFMLVMVMSIIVYGITNFVLLSNSCQVAFRLGDVETGKWLGWSAVSALILSLIMIILFLAVLGTILKRLNKRNQWVETHREKK